MTQLQLIQHMSAPGRRLGAKKLSHQLRSENFSLKELVDLTFYHDKEIALKATKLLEYMLFKFPESYYQDIDHLLACAADVKSASIKRYYAKIIRHITSPEVPREMRNKVKETDLDKIVELCHDWLTDPKMLIGVRASAAEALFNMRHRYPWVAEELSRQLEMMLPKATPMLKARANYVLSFLHCED